MIFITVGTQLPFDRLMESFAEWKASSGYSGEIIAQVGMGSHFTHPDMTIVNTLSSDEYYHRFCQAHVIVSHAGMGSILSCLDHGKRGVFMPRQYALGEHRNDHQRDTASAFAGQYPSLAFCYDKQAFFSALDVWQRQEANDCCVRGKSDSDALGINIANYLKLRGK